MAPEYALRGYLTDKADVYSFGIVALEIVSGKSNTNYRPEEEFFYLLDWAYVLHEQGSLLELVDSGLGNNYNDEEAMMMLNLALLCTNISPSLRPSMSSIVSMLEGKSAVQAPVINRGSVKPDMRFKALLQDSQSTPFSKDAQVQKTGDSSTSSVILDWDLYDPSTSSVASVVEGKSAVQAPVINRGSMKQDMMFKAFEKLSHDSQSTPGDCSASSRLLDRDLYEVNLNSF